MPEYEIDFVVDCGADPTGTNNCASAWQKAMTLITTLSADSRTLAYAPGGYKKAFTLLVPPGKYKFTTNGGNTDFLQKVSYLTIKGFPSASIFQFAIPGSGSAFAQLSNTQHTIFEDLVFEGLNNTNLNADMTALWAINAQYGAVFSRCYFVNLLTDLYQVYTVAACEFRECIWLNSGSLGATSGCIFSDNASSILLRGCTFTDASTYLNGVSYPLSKVSVNVNYLWADASGSRYIGIIDCLMDEGCTRNFRVNGGAGRCRFFEMRGNIVNPAVHVGAIATVQVINVDHFLVDGITQATVGAFASPYYDLQSVKLAEIKNHMVTVGSTFAPVVQSDAACGRIRVTNPTNWNETGIAAGASVIEYEENGILSDVLTAGAGITANRLLKLSAAGTVIELVVGDVGNVALVRGVAFRTAANGARIAVVKPCQVVTMLNDGAAPIALNGRVAPSGAQVGRVVAAAALGSALGIATAAAAGVLDTPVFVWYVPGNMGVA